MPFFSTYIFSYIEEKMHLKCLLIVQDNKNLYASSFIRKYRKVLFSQRPEQSQFEQLTSISLCPD